MFRLHFQYFEIFLKSVKSAHFNGIFYNISKSVKYLFVYKNISESLNFNVAVKYFAIFDKNVATTFQLQWKIGNISDTFLQYSVLCGPCIYLNRFIFHIWYTKKEIPNHVRPRYNLVTNASLANRPSANCPQTPWDTLGWICSACPSTACT